MRTPPLNITNKLESPYVEREVEEVVVQSILHGTRAIMISGAAGVGKTTLAMMVSQRLYDHFLGEVWIIKSNPLQSVSDSALSALPNTSQESLLIIDDLESISPSHVENELQRVLNSRPKTKIILTSRRSLASPSIEHTIVLHSFTHAEMQRFFHMLFKGNVEPDVIEKLYHQLQGNPLLAKIAGDALKAELFTPDDLFKAIEPFQREGLLGPDGRPLHPHSKSFDTIVSDTTAVSDKLLHKLAKEPKLLYEVSPRLFEEIVADLLGRLGYKVTLTPASRDGGKDIYAAKRDELGSFLYVVECKKYSPDNPVGVGLVRQLYGVVQAEKATAGILATTSFFTKGAKEFQTQVAYQISLQDYLGIQKWLKSV